MCWEHSKLPANFWFFKVVWVEDLSCHKKHLLYCASHLYLPSRSRDALSTGDMDGVVQVLWFLTLEVVMAAAVLFTDIWHSSSFSVWLLGAKPSHRLLLPHTLAAILWIWANVSAGDKKGYSRCMNHSASLYSVVYNFLCTSVVVCAYRLIIAEMFPSFLCVCVCRSIRIG